ncbi:hypothetical protein D3C77_398950 [compost metagenome]
MKKSVISLSLLLALATGQAMASTTDVKLKGSIGPKACTPMLSNGGVVDFGNISASDLIDGQPGYYQLGVTDLTLTIQCAAATKFTLRTEDNRYDTRSTDIVAAFGLGEHDGGDIGYMTIGISKATADGASIQIRHSTNNGSTWANSSGWVHSKQRLPNFLFGFGGNATGPAAVKEVSTTLQATAFTQKSLDYSDDITIDGNNTIELNYL